jgi:hypothetical protein
MIGRFFCGTRLFVALLNEAHRGECRDGSATECYAENHAGQNITEEMHPQDDARDRDADRQKK